MDGSTGGRCQEPNAIRGYHHTVKGKIHTCSASNAVGDIDRPMTGSHVNILEVKEMKMCGCPRVHTLTDNVGMIRPGID